MSDKVQFQTNVPIDVALKYNDGKEVTGQYGDQVFYTLTDGRVMYVPPIVKRKIDGLGIGRGELFTIMKAEKKNGTRRTIEWVVATDGNGERKPEAFAQRPNGQATPCQHNGGSGSSLVNGKAQRPGSPGDPKGFLVTSQGQFLLQAFSAAVDVSAATERYAAAYGMDLQFTSEDLREIGLSIYTSRTK